MLRPWFEMGAEEVGDEGCEGGVCEAAQHASAAAVTTVAVERAKHGERLAQADVDVKSRLNGRLRVANLMGDRNCDQLRKQLPSVQGKARLEHPERPVGLNALLTCGTDTER